MSLEESLAWFTKMSEIDKTALITGAAKRVGRSLALYLANQGWHIAAHYNQSRLEAKSLADEIESLGKRCVILEADLQNVAEVESLLPRANAALGQVELLINNAAVFEKDSIKTLCAESWQRHQAINQLAPLLLTRSFAQQLPVATSGNVVNLLDGVWGWSLSPDFLSYTASKQGLHFLTEFLAKVLAPQIRINGIALGPILPGQQDAEDTFARIADSAPLKRNSNLEDVYKALSYILSAPTLTGQIIAIASGLHLRFPYNSI